MRILFSILFICMFSCSAFSATEPKGDIPERQKWSFSGPFGTYDRDQLRRGLLIFQMITRSAHGLKYMSFRQLMHPDGPALTEEEAKEFAGDYSFPAVNEEGENISRSGLLTDKIRSPYMNPAEAAYLNSGRAPVDLTYITKARTYSRGFPHFITDIFEMYTEHGSDYVFSYLTGFENPPEGFTSVGYNRFFDGRAVAMPQPLVDGHLEYPKNEDGTPKAPETMAQYARDITAFLSWAADPYLPQRKRTGLWVMGYMIILTGLLYLLVWRKEHEKKHVQS